MQAGVYRHYKGGLYQVIGVGQNSETDELVVVYISLTGANLPGPRIRVRPLTGRGGWETTENGKERFTYVGDSPEGEALAASGTEAAPSDEHPFYSRGTMQAFNKLMAAASPEGEGREFTKAEILEERLNNLAERSKDVSGELKEIVADMRTTLRQSAAPSGVDLREAWFEYLRSLAQESKTGAAPPHSPLRTPQGEDKHGDLHSESKGGQQ